MIRNKHACLCGAQSESEGPPPPCWSCGDPMHHWGTREDGQRESGPDNASVQKLHEVANRAAYSALTLLPATNAADIVDAQECGDAGLCKPGSLPDGFELGGRHLVDREHFAELGFVGRGVGVCKFLFGFAVEAVVYHFARFVVHQGNRAVKVNYLVIDQNLGHFHSPVNRGAPPRCCASLIGPMARTVKREMQDHRTIFVRPGMARGF